MKIKFAFYFKVFALSTHEHEQEHHLTVVQLTKNELNQIII